MQSDRFVIAALCALTFCIPSPAEVPSSPTEANLEKLMNQYDSPQSWKNVPAQMAPAAAPTAPAQRPQAPWMRAAPRMAQFASSLRNSPIWRAATSANACTGMPAQGWAASSAVPEGIYAGQNPFNLSPFGVLHYLWDPTTYTSSSDPVSLTEVRSDLQQAQQYSVLAESAAKRAKYATDPQERQSAAAQAQQYANMSRAAADRANAVAEGGSSNPADVAALAQQVAAQAQAQASQASLSAGGTPW